MATKKVPEMDRLIDMMVKWDIPFSLTTDICGNVFGQLWYPSVEEKVCDVICHEYSYGGKEGLLEMMGLLTEDEAKHESVLGWLTAEEVFHRILCHYTGRSFTEKVSS